MHSVIFWGLRNKELIKAFDGTLPQKTPCIFQTSKERRPALEKSLSHLSYPIDFLESESTHFSHLEEALQKKETSFVFFDFFSIYFDKGGPLSPLEYSKLKSLLELNQNYIFLLPAYKDITKNALKRFSYDSCFKQTMEFFEQIKSLYELVINSYSSRSYILASPLIFSYFKDLYLEFDRGLSFETGKFPFVFKIYPMAFAEFEDLTGELKTLLSKIEKKNDDDTHIKEIKAKKENPYYKKTFFTKFLRKLFLKRFSFRYPSSAKKAHKRALNFYVILSILTFFSK